MGEDLGQQQSQLGPRFEQPVKIDPARQPLDDIGEAVERMLRIGAGGDGSEQAGQHRFKCGLRRRRAQ